MKLVHRCGTRFPSSVLSLLSPPPFPELNCCGFLLQVMVSIHYSDVLADSWFFVNFWGQKSAIDYQVRVQHLPMTTCKEYRGGTSMNCIMFNFRASGERVLFAGFVLLLPPPPPLLLPSPSRWASVLSILTHSVSLLAVTTM